MEILQNHSAASELEILLGERRERHSFMVNLV